MTNGALREKTISKHWRKYMQNNICLPLVREFYHNEDSMKTIFFFLFFLNLNKSKTKIPTISKFSEFPYKDTFKIPSKFRHSGSSLLDATGLILK